MELTVLFQILKNLHSADSPVLRQSDQFADVLVTNQFGKKFRFRSDLVSNRAIIVNTMYTTCRGTCPDTSSRVAELREKLSPVFGSRLVFLSLTLEPAVDKPEVLLKYADIYGAGKPVAGMCDWHFLTGMTHDIEILRRSLGFYDLNPAIDNDPTRHSAVLKFGNAQRDRWAQLPSADRLEILVEAIRRTAGFTFEQRYGIKS